MRCVYWIALAAFVLVLASGCLQPANIPAPTPTPQFVVIPGTTAPVTVTTIAEKQVSFAVTTSKTMLNITYNGGPDAADLQTINIKVTNQDGTVIPRTIETPTVGSTYVFTYRGNANPSVVNIIGTFTGGYQQTVLMYYV
jgi:hypothetical protein